ncbi:hypothetical protein K2V61_12395 [Staphylococcus simulans]|uniref:hypothetical protein n=1 Tax=Staphylococcus simulans TaxID=1286 RepID=UPI001E46D459|nr:hypothetical protein [Staphylococcus simulans]MCD8916339.1 hypothetical protein [Staphylococcus simulans]
MAMKKEQAIEILKLISSVYDMGFFENDKITTKGQIWFKKLYEKGDYKKSYRAADKHIEEKIFKPVLADILVKPVKVLNTEPDLETKKHLERLENDPEYRERMRKKREELAEHFKDILENKGVKDDEHNSE